MDNFTSMQCKNCGNNLYSKFKKRGNDFVCGCCGSWFRSKENEDTHCESGYAMLNTYHFDEAKLIFQNTITENPDNIDALWGWLLAEYRIIFVKGFYNDVIEPIYCFDQYEMFKTRSILNEIEYEKILKLLADDRELLNSYREKAEKIDRSMAHFKECKNKTENDVFICVKISTSTEKETRPRDERTKDFEFAEKLYKDLKAKGKKPFFSFYTLKNQVNSDDLIWTSLVKSKKMVLIGSQKDYFESVWVESEWKRWIFLDRMPNLYILTLPEKNQAPYDILPTELASNQIYTQATYNKLLHDLCEKPVLAAAPKKRTGTKAFFGVLAVCGVAAAAVLALGATGNLELPFLPSQTTVTTVQSTTQGGASTVQTTNTSATAQTTASTQGTVMPGVSNTTQTTATTQGTTHEHSYSEWVVTKKATCTENGEKTRSCSCGAEENQDIPAAHNEITIPGVKPTCTKDGLTDGKKCIVCGETTLKQVTAFSEGHKSETIPAVPPTCTEPGLTEGVGCSECGEVLYAQQPVPAEGHSYGAWTVNAENKTVRPCKYENCNEALTIVSIYTEYKGDTLTTLEQINVADIKVMATLSDGSTEELSGFTLEQNKVTHEGKNEISLNFHTEKTTVTIPGVYANLAGANSIEDFNYTIEDGYIKITGYKGTRTNVIIPSHLNKVPVRVIGEYAFRYSEITSVVIPGSVQTLETAFHQNPTLEKVVISEGVTKIGSNAFSHCSKLESVEIPASVTYIGGAFANCKALKSVKFAEGSKLTTIDGTFLNCESLESIELPEGLTNIEWSAFSGCKALKSIHIPASLKVIENGIFKYCESLKTVTFAEGIELSTIGAGLFYGCKSLESIELPEGVTSIGEDAFSGCTSLKSVYLPESLTNIGNSAFYSCKVLESVEIPAGVTSIGGSAFSGCSLLNSVSFAEENKITSIGDHAFKACVNLRSIKLPEGITSVPYEMFMSCTALASVEIPSGVTSIGISAFRDCKALTEIKLPAGVTSIGGSAFSGCASLAKINIPEGVTSIGSSAFSGCAALTSIEIPKGVTVIEAQLFNGCTSLKTVTFAEGIKISKINSYYAFSDCTSLESIELPEGLKSIGERTFKGCTSLASVYIPASVTEIGADAFSGCKLLKNVNFAEKTELKSIGNYAFYGCENLESIVIPEGITSIEYYTFCDCTSLKSVYIPVSVTSFGSYAFYRCESLKTIDFGGTEEQWKNITKSAHSIPEGVTVTFAS